MDWKTFGAELSKAWAWPVAAVIIVYALRKEVSDLLKRLVKLKWGDKEAEFNVQVKMVEEAGKDAEATPASKEPEAIKSVASQSDPSEETFKQKLRAMPDVAPAAAVAEVYREVEIALRLLVRRYIPTMKLTAPPLSHAYELYTKHYLPVEQLKLIDNIITLRAKALHVEEPTAQQARIVVEAALPLILTLRRQALDYSGPTNKPAEDDQSAK